MRHNSISYFGNYRDQYSHFATRKSFEQEIFNSTSKNYVRYNFFLNSVLRFGHYIRCTIHSICSDVVKSNPRTFIRNFNSYGFATINIIFDLEIIQGSIKRTLAIKTLSFGVFYEFDELHNLNRWHWWISLETFEKLNFMIIWIESIYSLKLKHSKERGIIYRKFSIENSFWVSVHSKWLASNLIYSDINGLNMIPKWIEYVLKYYSFWGFHATSFAFSRKIVHNSVFVAHIILCGWCTLQGWISFVDGAAFMEFLDVLNFSFYYITGILLYWLIIYDSFVSRNVEFRFWHNFFQIPDKFGRQLDATKFSFFIPLIALTIGDSFMFIFAIVFEKLSDVNAKMMHVILLGVIDHRIFFYLFHLHVVASQLRQLTMEVKQMQQNSLISGIFDRKRFNWIHKYYNSLYEMSCDINQIFGWSHLVLITLSFLSLVTNLNFTYRKISGKAENINFGWYHHVQWLSSFIWPLQFNSFLEITIVSVTYMICRITSHLLLINKYTNECYTPIESIYTHLFKMSTTIESKDFVQVNSKW